MSTLVELFFKANTKELDEAQRKLVGVTNAAKDASPATDKVGISFTRMSGGAIAAGAGIAMIAAALIKATADAIKFADALGDLADATGISVEELSIMEKVARESGTSWEQVSDAVVKFTRSMGQAQKSTSEQAEVLNLLGVGPNATLEQVAQALNRYDAGVGKAYATSVLFGKQGHEINEFLKDYATKGDVAADITTKQAEAADRLSRAWNKIGSEMTTVKNDVFRPFTIMLGDMLEGIIIHLQYVESAPNRIKKAIVGAVAAFGPFGALIANLKNLYEFGKITTQAAQRNALNTLDGVEERHDSRGGQLKVPEKPAGGGKPRDMARHGWDDIADELKKETAAASEFWKDYYDNYEKVRKAQQDGYATLYSNESEYQRKLDNQIEQFARISDKTREAKERLKELESIKQEFIAVHGVDAYSNAWNNLNHRIGETETRIKPVADGMKDMFAELTRAIEGYTQRMSDAFVDFAFTGKMSFGDMIRSMLSDLAKMAMNNMFKQLLSMGSSGGKDIIGDIIIAIMGAADGGPVGKNRTTLVGEKGPELFVPSSVGTIIPNNMLGGGGGMQQVNNINIVVKGGTTNNETGSAVSQAVVNAMRGIAKDEVIRARRPGGSLNPMTI